MKKKRISAAALALVMTMSSTNAFAAGSGGDLMINSNKFMFNRFVDGNVVVASPINRLNMYKVSANGALDIRKEVKDLNLSNCNFLDGILVQDRANIEIKSGNVNKIRVTADVDNMDLKVYDRASVDEIHLDGTGTEIKGTGSVDTVYVHDGEAAIYVPNTRVVVGAGADGVKAGGVVLQPGETVIVNPDGNGVQVIVPEKPDPEKPGPENPDPEKPDPEKPGPENPDPEKPDPEKPGPENPDPEKPGPENPDPEKPDPEKPGPENPDPENPDPEKPDPEKPGPEQPQLPEAQLVDSAKVVDLGWTRFVAVDFAEGSSLANCTLNVDGVDVTKAATKVTDNGSLVKWEITSPEHQKLVVSNGTEQQTILLGGKGAAPEVVLGQTPDYFLMNGPVYVWDYHLTNYDESGNIRYAPEKTTFDLDAVSSASIPHHSPDAILYHDDNALPYFVKGEVQLMFNYAYGAPADKAFVDGITDVDLVSFNEYNNTLNDELHYELDKNFVHGDHTVACIKVPLGQVNFTSNGRYNLRVTSNGVSKLFPIHVVDEVKPTMTVTGDTGYYGNEVHFRIENMTYGVTRPVYRVELTNPDGKTATLAKFDDWFLHGDLLVLYNSIHNYFPETGSYTVTVYADGFQTFGLTFWQNAIPNRDESTVAEYDAISTASVGGGGSSGGGSSDGDSKFMNANLIVDADLLANAKIITELGIDNEAAISISKRWDNMSKLYTFNEGAEQVYTYDGFYSAVNAALVKGEHLSFAEYIASEGAVTTPNRPYSVKQVLEDNLLGETTGFLEAVGKPASALTAEVVEDTVVITVADETYMAAVAAEGQLILDGNSLPLQNGKDFTISGNTITLKNVEYGAHELAIRVPAYQTARVSFQRVYPLEQVELTAHDIVKGEQMVITCNGIHENGVCDFMSHITGVQLIAPNGNKDDVMPDGAESVFEKIGYVVDTRNLIIGEDTLNQAFAQNEDGTFAAGVYKVIITAEHYGDIAVTLNVADAPEQPGDKVTPVVSGITLEGGVMGQYHRVSFVNESVADYLSAITSITLNGQPAKQVTNLFGETKAYQFSNDPAYGGENKFIDFTADCFGSEKVVVEITASGYENLTFDVVNGQPEITLTEAPVISGITLEGGVMGQYNRVAFEGDVTDYLPAITSITLNGQEAKLVTNLFNETKAYQFSNDPAYGGADKFIDFTTDCFAGLVEVVVKADGYEDLIFTVQDGEIYVPIVAAPQVAEITEVGGVMGKSYKVSFQQFEGITDYLNAVTGITLNGTAAKQVTNLFNETQAFKLSVMDSSNSVTAYDCIEFTADAFAGTVEVVVKAEGYEDVVFTVVDGKLKGDEPQLPAAPAVSTITAKSSFSGNYYIVAFEGGEEVAAPFVEAITAVSVNGQEVKRVTSFFNDTMSYKTSNDPAYGGAYQFVDFTADCFAGEKTVVIEAEGFAPLTFQVVDGALVK